MPQTKLSRLVSRPFPQFLSLDDELEQRFEAYVEAFACDGARGFEVPKLAVAEFVKSKLLLDITGRSGCW